MENLIRHIEFLLSQHDCVVVPGLGAFLATRQSSSHAESMNLFSYPHRIYTFNSELRDGEDKLLYHSIARSLGISIVEAETVVKQAVDEIKDTLSHNGEVVIGRIGRIDVTMLGELSFEPYKTDRITPLAGWIGDIIISDVDSILNEDKNQEAAFVAAVRPSRWVRVMRSALGAAAAVLIAIVASTPIIVDDITPSNEKEVAAYTASTVLNVTPPAPIIINQESTGDFNIAKPDIENIASKSNSFRSDSCKTDTFSNKPIEELAQTIQNTEIKTAEETKDEIKGVSESTTPIKQQVIDRGSLEKKESPVVQAKPNAVKQNEVKQKAVKADPAKTAQQTEVSQPIRFEHNDPYILVVASLASRADAEKFLVDYTFLCDFPLGIQEFDGKYRIYAATGANINDAMKYAGSKNISKHFKNAWVTHR